MVLIDSDEDLGRVTEYDGEPVFSQAINTCSFEFVDLAFFAGEPSTTKTYAHLAQQHDFVLVDLTNAFSKDAEIPLFLGYQEVRGLEIQPFRGLVSSPHPASISIASILKQLSLHCELRHCVVSIFEPASERGSTGVEELEQQTLSIFSFQKGPQTVFDRQLAFNLLFRLGEEAREKLIDVEKVVSTQLTLLLGSTFPLPALTLIQAPIFHAHCFSFFVEVDPAIEITELERFLQSEHLSVTQTADEPPSPVGVAGTDTIQIGGMKRDFLNPNGLWFWAVSDNLRLSAVNAVSAAEAIFLQR
jgi:aspartate-semialdehyde dehydrogenase